MRRLLYHAIFLHVLILEVLALNSCGRVAYTHQNHAGLGSVSGDVYCNGQPVSDGGGSLYPNGQRVVDSRDVYYPNGRKIFDSWGIYYDNGKKIHDTWGTYYADGDKISDSWGVYYPNGQKIKDSWGCYFANGQRMVACPEFVRVRYATPDSGALLKHTVRVDSGAIGNIDQEWSMIDGTRMSMTLVPDLINHQAQVLNVQAICDG
jgi:hypothetical protein